jgi:hypothetical protein
VRVVTGQRDAKHTIRPPHISRPHISRQRSLESAAVRMKGMQQARFRRIQLPELLLLELLQLHSVGTLFVEQPLVVHELPESPDTPLPRAGGPLKLFWLESGRRGLVEPTSE